MNKKRANFIDQLERERGSKVITYIVSDREPREQLGGQIALDVIPVFYRHLREIGETEKLDLFLYSRGGHTIAPWRLVNLVREYCKNFSVLIPYRAHSAATLIALGANEIIMGPLAELSPIDPSISSPFNPPTPGKPGEKKVQVNVEDVFGYINLAREKMDISDQDNITSVLERLIDHLHPLALGGVYRSHALIRLLAQKLLSLHMQDKDERRAIPQIVGDLAEKLYYHEYLISRKEAGNLGLKVVEPHDKLEALVWDLYLTYENKIGLNHTFNPTEYLGDETSVEKDFPIAIIESARLQSIFRKRIGLSKQIDPKTKKKQINMQTKSLGWETKGI